MAKELVGQKLLSNEQECVAVVAAATAVVVVSVI